MNKSRLARMDRVVTHSTKSNLRTRSENNSFRMVAETLLVRSLFMPQSSDWKPHDEKNPYASEFPDAEQKNR